MITRSLLLLLFIWSQFSLFAQFKGEWKELPQVRGTDAVVTKKKAEIASRIPRETPFKVTETFSKERYEFYAKLTPDTIAGLTFEVYDLAWNKKIPIPNGMIFKDDSKANIKYLDMAHGLISNLVWTVSEGKNGMMYFGTDKGLVAFNGAELLVYYDAPEFSFENVTSLYYDSRGRLWINANGNICYLFEDKLYIPNKQLFGQMHMKGISGNGLTDEIFFCTIYNGLFVFRNGDFLHYEKQLPTKNLSHAIRSQEGKLWIAFGSDGFGFLKSDSLFLYEREGVGNTARALIEVNDEVWIGMFAGQLSKYRNDSLFYVNLDMEKTSIYSLQKNNKGLWFSVYGAGVYLIKNNSELKVFGAQEGLSYVATNDVQIDRFDNVWASDLYSGISRIDENIISASEKAISENHVSEIEIDEGGSSWYFRDGGLLIHQEKEEYVSYANIGRFARDGFAKNSDLWMSNEVLGLTRLAGDSITHFKRTMMTDLDSAIRGIQPDEQGGIWGWDAAMHLYRFKNGKYYNYSKANGWKEFEFGAINKTADQTLFALTKNNGIVCIRANKYLHLTTENGLVSNRINHVFMDSEGAFWFTSDGKIQIFSTDGAIEIHELPSLAQNLVTDILEYEQDKFLLVTNDGILLLAKKGNSFRSTFYGKDYGLNLVDNRHVIKDANGDILISGGTRWLLEFDPYFFGDNQEKPMLSLQRVTVGDSLIQGIEDSKIGQGKKITLTFNKIRWGLETELL